MTTTPRDAIGNGENETTQARAAVDAIMERYADEIVDNFTQEKPPPRRRSKPPNRRQQIMQEAQERQAQEAEKKKATVEPISPLKESRPATQDWPTTSRPVDRKPTTRIVPDSPKTWHDNWKGSDNPIEAQGKKTAAAKEEAKKRVAERIENERQKNPTEPSAPRRKRKRFEPKDKVLVTTHMVKSGDVGYHGNLFGGTMLGWLDEAAGVLACQVADSSQMVTLKIEELLFLHPVRPGQIIKIYGSVDAIGKTSVRLNIEARSHRVQDGRQRKVVSTRMTFVNIDGAGDSMMINDTVREKWGFERLT